VKLEKLARRHLTIVAGGEQRHYVGSTIGDGYH